jgi:hypothetical protein
MPPKGKRTLNACACGVMRVSPTTIGSAEVFSSRMKSDSWGIHFGLSDLLWGCAQSNQVSNCSGRRPRRLMTRAEDGAVSVNGWAVTQVILYRIVKSHKVTIG